MGKKSKRVEVIVRFFDNYADLWFKNEFTDFMRENNGKINTVDLFFQFEIIKDRLVEHLIDNIKMNKVISVNLIEHMVKDKYEQHMKSLISSLS